MILSFSIFQMNQKILNIFWKILFLKIFTSVLTNFVWEEIDFEIFNFLDESEDSEKFLKNSIFEKKFQMFWIILGNVLEKVKFWKIYKCFDPFCMRKKCLNDKNWRLKIIFPTSENHFSHVWKSFFPLLGKNGFQTWEKRFSDVGKMIFRRHAIFFQTLSIFLQTSYFFPMKLLQIKKSHLRSSYLENTGKNEKKEMF